MVRLWWLVDRRALLVTAGCLVGWRLLSQIPMVDVTGTFIHSRLEVYGAPGVLPAIGPNSIAFESYSLGFLGIGPYVNALIVVSLLAVISGRVREMLTDAEGRLRLERWTRALALLLALGQAYGWIQLAENAFAVPGGLDWFPTLTICLEMAGGTAVMIALASALDEYGLGFGFGPLVLYALNFVAGETHRIVGYFATAPSTEALYRPVAVWAAFTVAATVVAVAILLAYRRYRVVDPDAEMTRPVDVKLLASGVLRPSMFAFGFLSVPTLIAQNLLARTTWLEWGVTNWSPYGPVAWLAITYIVVECALLACFAMAVAMMDASVAGAPLPVVRRIGMLGLLGGACMALVIAVVRPLAHYATQGAGQLIAVSGFDVLVVVTMVLMVVLWIEGRGRNAPLTTTPALLP
jgi:preprotein translocase subunit SecY